jgi:hypothetical protein
MPHALPAANPLPVPTAPAHPACRHRRWRGGGRGCGENVPGSAQGAFFPGEEPGEYCALTDEPCAPYPPECPEWKPSELVCPACLEFRERGWPQSLYRSSRLLARESPPGRRGFYCPLCDESYADAPAVAALALDRLRDALDDLACLEAADPAHDRAGRAGQR